MTTGRRIRRKGLHPRGAPLPGTARPGRVTMEDAPRDHGGAQSQGAQAGPVEPIPAPEPLQPGRRVLQSRVWPDGGVSGEERGCS